MRNLASAALTALILAAGANEASAQSQNKGIDTTTKQIQDNSTNRGPTDNANKTNVGTGPGFDFGAGKTPVRVLLANPYRLASKRDILLAQVADLMRERNLVVDEAASRPADGILVAQPFTFVKGAVTAQNEINRYANLPQVVEDDDFTRGRYTMRVEVQSIDGTNNNVSVTAKVEAKSETVTGAQWQTLDSSGLAEDEFLGALVERITGTNPNAVPSPVDPQ